MSLRGPRMSLMGPMMYVRGPMMSAREPRMYARGPKRRQTAGRRGDPRGDAHPNGHVPPVLAHLPHPLRGTKKEQLKRFYGLSPENKGHNVAVTALYVPCSLESHPHRERPSPPGASSASSLRYDPPTKGYGGLQVDLIWFMLHVIVEALVTTSKCK